MPVPTEEDINSIPVPIRVTPPAEDSYRDGRCSGNHLRRSTLQTLPDSYLLPVSQVQNMILVQVNPGETFTIEGDDGSRRNISGPAEVPMLSPNGAIPTIFVPPGYVSQVIEDNGVRKMVVVPSIALTGIGDGNAHFIEHPHSVMAMHNLQQSHAFHSGVFPPAMIPNCRPEALTVIPRPMYMSEDMNLPDADIYSSTFQECWCPCHIPACSEVCFYYLHGQYQSELDSENPTRDISEPSEHAVEIEGSCKLLSSHQALCCCPARGSCAFAHRYATDTAGKTKVDNEIYTARRTCGTQVNMYKSHEKNQRRFWTKGMEACSGSEFAVPGVQPHFLYDTPPTELHPGNTLQHSLESQGEISKQLQGIEKGAPLSSSDSPQGASSVTSSPASSSSYTSSPRGSPETCKSLSFANEQKESKYRLNMSSSDSIITHPDIISSHVAMSSNLEAIHHSQKVSGKSVSDGGSTVVSTERDSTDPNQSTSVSTSGTSESRVYQTIDELLRDVRKPEVVDIQPKSAKVVWNRLPIEQAIPEARQKVNEAVILFDLSLTNHKKDGGKFRSVYSGDDQKYICTDLRPATGYSVKFYAIFDTLKGPYSEVTTFHTPSCPPDAPQPPKLANRTKNTMLLKWTAPIDNGEKISKYYLEWDEGNQGSDFHLLVGNSQKQFKIVKLMPSRAYTFRLAAENKMGTSLWSPPVCYHTSGTVPITPEAPRLTKAHVKSLALSWEKLSGKIMGYTLEMNDETTGYGFRPVYNGLELKFVVKNLMRNSHYKFRLFAYNNEGKSKYSDVVSYVTMPDKPFSPGKPRLKGNVHARFFTVVWDAPKDSGGAEITEYVLEMSTERNGHMGEIYTGVDQDCLVEGLEPGCSYRLRVSCVSSGGKSVPSEVAIVTTSPVTPGECQPPMLALRPKPTCLTIKWELPRNTGGTTITCYEVHCTTTPNHEAIEEGETQKIADTECTIGQLRPGTEYYFMVRAANKIGFGPWSSKLSVLTSPGVPDKPEFPDATVLNSTSIHLQWNEPENNGTAITNYKLLWGGAESSMNSTSTGLRLTYQLTQLHPNTVYYYSIQAINNVGQSPVSDVASATTPPSYPSRVTNLRHAVIVDELESDANVTQANTTATSTAVQWDVPHDNGSEITGYKIHVAECSTAERAKSDEQDSAEDLIELDESCTYYCANDLQPDTDYSIKVCAVNSIGCGCFSSSLRLRTKPLPPDAPVLTCVQNTVNSLKLKWAEVTGSGNGTQYLLQMRDRNGRFSTVYSGSNCGYRVPRLLENTAHRFRINASNAEGVGQFSPIYVFTTIVQVPLTMEAPVVSAIESTWCEVSWPRMEPIKGDSIFYRLCLESSASKRNDDWKETGCGITDLSPNTEYRLRIAAVRQSTSARYRANDDSSSSETAEEWSDLQGPFSNTCFFTTQESEPEGSKIIGSPRLVPLPETGPVLEHELSKKQKITQATEPAAIVASPIHPNTSLFDSLSDNAKTMVWLGAFMLFAILSSFVLKSVLIK